LCEAKRRKRIEHLLADHPGRKDNHHIEAAVDNDPFFKEGLRE
jgi:hypothetical protein